MAWERTKDYWQRVKQDAQRLNGDGCSDSPDLFYRRCCDEHDIAYRTGADVDGVPTTRKDADAELFKCMCKTGKTPVLGRFIIPSFYWIAVRLFGSKAWKGQVDSDKPT